jgi:RNA polymerase sigma-70 factor (ECF subfamily)
VYTAGVTPSEENKLVRAAQHNVEAFEALYDLYFPKVYGFVMGRIRRQDVAEDLVSEIFMKILEGLPKYTFKGYPFGAWVFQVARNHLYDYYAKSKRQQVGQLEDPDWLEADDRTTDPVAQVAQKELRTSLENLMSVLTDQERDVVQLRYFAQLSNQEIAETLGLSPNNVGVILYHSLKKLKAEHD